MNRQPVVPAVVGYALIFGLVLVAAYLSTAAMITLQWKNLGLN